METKRKVTIESLLACEKGNCNECVYHDEHDKSGVTDSDEIDPKSCYDKLMLDAADVLKYDEVTRGCVPPTDVPETCYSEEAVLNDENVMTEEKESVLCDSRDGHEYASIDSSVDRVFYLCMFIRDKMINREEISLERVHELDDLVRYHNLYCVPAENRRKSNWDSYPACERF